MAKKADGHDQTRRKAAQSGKTGGTRSADRSASRSGRKAGAEAGAGSGGGSEQKQRLERELAGLLPQLDEEGLIFLIRQAHVIIHNLQVDQLNQEIDELQGRKQSGQPAGRSQGGRSQGGRADEGASARVDIEESATGGTFHLVLPDTRKVLGLEEMRALVRACYEPKRKSAALRRMFRWMEENRRDILTDGDIRGEGSPLLDSLFSVIRSRFRLREE